MAATNLYFARHMDGSRVREDQIKVGLEIMAPSPTGGIFRYVCQSRNDEVAFFKNTNPDWPLWSDLVVQFYQKDLSALDFEFVLAGVNGMDYGNFLPNQYRAYIHKAALLGYVREISFTQVHYTEKFTEAFRTLYNDVAASLNEELEFVAYTNTKLKTKTLIFPIKHFNLSKFGQDVQKIMVNSALGEVKIYEVDEGFCQPFCNYYHKLVEGVVSLVNRQFEVPARFIDQALDDEFLTLESAINSFLVDLKPKVSVVEIQTNATNFRVDIGLAEQCEISVPTSIKVNEEISPVEGTKETFTWAGDLAHTFSLSLS